jgi:hypothetical protein
VGSDTITGGSATDSIVTDGGADTVTLGAGHTGDVVGIYVAAGTSVATPGAAPVGGIVGAITNANDLAQPGFWGVGPGGTPIVPTTAFADSGTSASMTVVNGFSAGAGDTVDFSVGEWAFGPPHFGLENWFNNVPTVAPGAAVFTNPVVAGGSIAGSPNSPDLVLLFTTPEVNAAQLASTLHTVGLGGVALAPGNEVHGLAVYQDLGGSVRIADVDYINTSAAPITNLNAPGVVVAASDMVQLVGVSLQSLISHELPGNVSSNIHFIA